MFRPDPAAGSVGRHFRIPRYLPVIQGMMMDANSATAAKSTILQCSKVHPGIADDPDRVLDDLFQRYVL